MKADMKPQSEVGQLLKVSICNKNTQKQGLEGEVAMERRTK